MRSRQKNSIGRGSPRMKSAAPTAVVIVVGLALLGLSSAAQADTGAPPVEEPVVVAEQADAADAPSDDVVDPAESEAEEPAAPEQAPEEQEAVAPPVEEAAVEEAVVEETPAAEEAPAAEDDAPDAEEVPVEEDAPAEEDAPVEEEASDADAAADVEVVSDDAIVADAALAEADTAPMMLAAAAEPEETDGYPHMLVASVSLVDANDDSLTPPQEFDWTITATGPADYSSDDGSGSFLVAYDPVPGAYTFDVQLNAAAAAQLTLSEVFCSYTERIGEINEDWLGIQYRSGDRWAVDVRPAYATACSFIYEVTGPLPDPHFTLTDLFLQPAEGEGRTRLNVADPSDFVVVLRTADGTVAGTVAPGGDVQVPAGTYTRTVEASASAQPGFDRDAWVVSDWNCNLPADQRGYGAAFELVPGQEVHCGVFVTDARADLWTSIDRSDDVGMDWDGVFGEVGALFDTTIEVSNMLSTFDLPAVDDLRVTVRMGDNTELVDPAGAPAGWTLVSVDGDAYTYAYDSSLPLRGDAVLVLPMRLTAATPGRAVEACASTVLPQESLENDCALLHAVADGEPQPPTEPEPEPTQEPEPTPTPTPTPTVTPAPTPTATPTPEPTATPEPTPTATPSPTASATPAAKKDDALAATGSDPSGTIALGIGLLLLGALAVGARRLRRL